jgi:hypothetical protein
MKNNLLFHCCKSITSFALAMLFSVVSSAIDRYSAGDVLNVFALSGVNLRDAPRGNVIEKLLYGSSIRVLESKREGTDETIEGVGGNWVRVQFNSSEGYIFDGFLSSLPAPQMAVNEIQQYASKNFKSIKFVTLSYIDGFLGGEGIDVQMFKFNQDTIAYGIDYSWQGKTEYFSVPNISIEEAYLFLRALYRASYEKAIREWDNEESGEMDAESGLKGFILNGQNTIQSESGESVELYDHYFCDHLAISTYTKVRITKRDNLVFILVDLGYC